MKNPNGPDTNIGGSNRDFPSTHWSLLDGAEGDSDRRREAFRHLATAYWKPIYGYIRARWSRTNEDAKDLVQEFFASIAGAGLLSRFDPARGSFRRYVKGALELFVADQFRRGQALKRGGSARLIPLGSLGDDAVATGAANETPDEVLDRLWLASVVARSEDLLRTMLSSEGKEIYYVVFRDYFLGEGEQPTYEEMAARHKVATSDVSNYLQYAKQRYREILREIVAETVPNSSELDSEMDALFGGRPR